MAQSLILCCSTKGDYDCEIIKDQVEPLDFAVNFEIGYEFNNYMFIQGRYHLGLSNIDDYQETEGDTINRGSIKKRSFQIFIGYKF